MRDAVAQIPHRVVCAYRCRRCGAVFNLFTGTLLCKSRYSCAILLQLLRGIAQGVPTAHQTVNHTPGQREWARDDDADGDGVREVHSNTIEGLWTGLRNHLRPLRGVNKWFLSGYVAVFEWVHNLKEVHWWLPPAVLRALKSRRVTHRRTAGQVLLAPVGRRAIRWVSDGPPDF
jgi:hypothetical protein